MSDAHTRALILNSMGVALGAPLLFPKSVVTALAILYTAIGLAIDIWGPS